MRQKPTLSVRLTEAFFKGELTVTSGLQST